MRCLMLLYGQPFREGKAGFYKPEETDPERLIRQARATKTHLDFFEHLKNTFNISIDTVLCTYKAKNLYDLLHKKYNFLEDKDKNHIIDPKKTSRFLMINTVTQHIKKLLKTPNIYNTYDFIFALRIDVALKPYFLKCFDPYEQKIKMCFPVVFPVVDITELPVAKTAHKLISDPDEEKKRYSYNVRAGDIMFFFPKKLYKKVQSFKAHHTALDFLLKNKGLQRHEIDFYIHTRHNVNTSLSWNPLFWLTDRPFSKKKHNLEIFSDAFGKVLYNQNEVFTIVDYKKLYPDDLNDGYKLKTENELGADFWV